jgi:acetyl esterase/lipase
MAASRKTMKIFDRIHRLWDGDALGALGTETEDTPTLTEVSDPIPGTLRAGFIVCPGGGYGGLADYEGGPVAEWFESVGVKGFVLKYRLGPKYHHPVMIGDVNRAVRYVRANAAKFGVDPNRIGVGGFSAGGHLASTAVTYFDEGNSSAADPVEKASSRPDLGVLIYPVISMGPLGHAGSRENLLGKNPSPTLIAALSSEKNVSLRTPPCFIVHGADDAVVPVENSLMFATALSGHKIPFELKVVQHGPHGFAMGAPGTPMDWRAECAAWLKSHGF